MVFWLTVVVCKVLVAIGSSFLILMERVYCPDKCQIYLN